jgi:cobalt-zinc-cadmium efflux system outer membrane protein
VSNRASEIEPKEKEGKMNRSRAKLIHRALLPVALLASLSVAQTPLPNAPVAVGVGSVPRNLTLAQAEQLLLQRNLAILAARYQVDAFRAARLIASFKPNPILMLGAEQFNLSRHFFNDIFHTDPLTGAEFTATIRYDQLVERGGKRRIRTQLADYQLKSGEAQLLDAARTQLFQLRQAFTEAQRARENLELAEATRQEFEQTVRLTDAKVENGDLPRAELYRAQVAAVQYQEAVQQARLSYQQATRDILNALGARAEDVSLSKPPDGPTDGPTGEPAGGAQVVKASFAPDDAGAAGKTDRAGQAGQQDLLVDELLQIDFKFDDRPIAQSVDELRGIALAERPDVIAARHLYNAAERGTALARAQRVRDVMVGGFYQRIGSDNTAGVNVAFPLLIHNKGYAAIEQAEGQREAAIALSRQAEIQAITDVEKAHAAYQTARRILDLYNASTIERAKRLRTIATFSYREGASSLLELLDAERSYNQTIASYNQARADYQLALWQLEQAIGKPLR